MKARSLITSTFIGFTLLVGVVGYNAPPYIDLSNEAVLSNYRTDDSFMIVAGKISTLHNPELKINNVSVNFNDYGEFSHKQPLVEGETTVSIVAQSDKGTTSKQYKVHRTTTAEFVERKEKAEKLATQKKQTEEKAAVDKKKADETRALKAKQDTINAMPTCDGKSIKSSCKEAGSIYKTFVYYPAVAEKTRMITETTYREEVTGYCTLCNDGTYSPSCSTGRGTCSHHDGVAQWNAPKVSRVPVYTQKVIVDAPAVTEYYEKVLDPQFN